MSQNETRKLKASAGVIVKIFCLIMTLASCSNLTEDQDGVLPSESMPANSPPIYTPLPITDSYTYIPTHNKYQFANTAGGSFKVSQVYIYPQDRNTLMGMSSDGAYVYTLINNTKNFNGSYLINKFKLDGTEYSTCTWYGDGHYYNGISIENNIVYLKRRADNPKIVKYDFLNCQYLSLLNIVTSADAEGYYYNLHAHILVENGLIYLTYINGSYSSRIKSFSPTSLLFLNYAETQKVGQEFLKYDKQYIFMNNSLWTVRDCNAARYKLCFWRLNKTTNAMAYGYLPDEYYPELVPSNGNLRFILKGRNLNEIIHVVATVDEMHFYALDVAGF